MNQQDIISEYAKCYSDKSRVYMIENYFNTFDGTQKKTVKFKLFPRQVDLLKTIGSHDNVITTKPRQAGISTTVSAKIACELALASKDSPETVLIVANRLDLSTLDLKKIKEFLLQVPRWFWGENFYGSEENDSRSIFTKDNNKNLELHNGCKVHAVSSGPNAARGVSSVSWLIFDEAAFIERGREVYSQAVATTATGGHIIMISTPNGQDELYYDVYKKAIEKENNFKLVELKWFQDPRYNKNLKWEKLDEESGEVDTIVMETIKKDGSVEYKPEYWEKLLRKGYKPTSDWYEEMCNALNNDRQKIAQELDVSFLGSAGTVVDSKITEFHKLNNVREPIFEDDFYEGAWVFKEPIEGHRYIMPIDVSTGSGEDSSVIHVLDIDAIHEETGMPCIEQVFEYRGKVQGDILGDIGNKYGIVYGDALAIIDCVGSSGDACLLKMQSLNYKNIYSDDPNLKNMTNENAKYIDQTDEKKITGFRAGYLRMQMLSNLEYMLRNNNIIPRSRRFTGELDTWIWKNGRPDHQSGSHDDTLTSMAMGLFVYKFSLQKLEGVKQKTVSILRGMIAAQLAVRGGGENENSERIKKIPLPFYSGNALSSREIKSSYSNSSNDINKKLNIYLNSEINKYLKI